MSAEMRLRGLDSKWRSEFIYRGVLCCFVFIFSVGWNSEKFLVYWSTKSNYDQWYPSRQNVSHWSIYRSASIRPWQRTRRFQGVCGHTININQWKPRILLTTVSRLTHIHMMLYFSAKLRFKPCVSELDLMYNWQTLNPVTLNLFYLLQKTRRYTYKHV